MFQRSSFWLVLVAALVGYWLLPARARNWFLSAVSFAYLFSIDWGERSQSGADVWANVPGALAVLIFTVLFYAIIPRTIAANRWSSRVFHGLILAAIGYLAYAKYLPQLAERFARDAGLPAIVIPLGVSYFTFKLIHYAVEVGRGSMPKHGFADFLCYLLMFPTFSAGPIERFDHFLANRRDEWSWDLLLHGATRIAHGLIKRFAIVEVVLTPMLGANQDFHSLLSQLDSLPFYRVWQFLLVTFLIAYMDFSAYTDIAIGASRLFGVKIMENFNLPVAATSIGDFWRRWHMTLAGWCQSYVYMPLIGLTRNPYIAVYATFLTMGLWHAASWHWIAWGAYHATGITVQNAWTRWNRKRRRRAKPSPFSVAAGWLATLLFVSAGYAFTAGHANQPISASFRVLFAALSLRGL